MGLDKNGATYPWYHKVCALRYNSKPGRRDQLMLRLTDGALSIVPSQVALRGHVSL